MWKNPNSQLRPLMAALFVATSIGCGSDAIPTGNVEGRITVNGEPREGLMVKFVPVKKIRPAIGSTDSEGRYEAKLLADQTGVPLGKCRVDFELYQGDGTRNYLAEFNEKSADDPELNLEIFKDGLTFDYDIKYDGELPPET